MLPNESGGSSAPVSSGPDATVEGPQTRWQKFRLVVKVVELRLRFIVLMTITGLVFGYWDTIWNRYEKWARPPGAHQVVEAGTEYYCPMHPSVVQDEPGNCPICGMPLSKRAKGAKETLPERVTARVHLAPFRIAQAGIRTTEVSYEPLSESLTTVGFVAFDERRLARISSRLKGMSRVEKLFVNYTGTPVQKGQPLAELYSPELYQAVQELLLAHRSARDPARARTDLGRSLAGQSGDLVSLAAGKLKLWGITQEQINEILQQGRADYKLPILAPLSGVVVKKAVVEGQYVSEGEAMFEVADLGHVWVQAQVYEDQFDLVRVGQAVEATVEAFPGQVFRGTVAFIDPVLNPATRTVNVRYDLDNPDDRLRPGMFATVSLQTPVAEMPRFRAQRAANPLASLTPEQQKVCPVTGEELGSMGDPIAVEVQDRKVWVCCVGCPPSLKAEPTKYLARLTGPPVDGVLSVPESAVIDTGESQVVYVESDPGVFEGRRVVLGPRIGDRFPVLEGLEPGDQVAAAGAFLIDAESRLGSGAATHHHTGQKTSTGKNEPPPAHRHSGVSGGSA